MTDPTPHADRDRTEPPRGIRVDEHGRLHNHPPGAWWPPAAPAAYADLDEPVPFVLTDEPAGDLLPSAPEGVTLQCSMCPHTLADTRGGRLVHHDDGSHTYVPPGPYGLPEFLDVVNAELEHLRAAVTRVEALADWFEAQPNWREWAVHSQIRAALKGGA